MGNYKTGFYTYIIRCADNSLYTGYTTDIKRRVKEHKKGINCKYTKSRKYKSLEALFLSESKSNAMKLEAFIKQMSRNKKLLIIENPELLVKDFMNKKNIEIVYIDKNNILTG